MPTQLPLDFDRGRVLRLIDEAEICGAGTSQCKNLLRVLVWCGRDTGNSCPRLELVAYRMGVSLNTARRAVRAAERLGLLTVEARLVHAGGQRSNWYTIDESALAALPRTGAIAPSQDGGAPSQDGGAPSQDGGAPSQDGGAPSQDGGAPSQDGRANIKPGSLGTGTGEPSRRDTGAAGVSTKPASRQRAGGNGERPGAASVFAGVTRDLLADTEALVAWAAAAARRERPVVSDSEADRLRVLGAAERALEVADNPPALFASIVSRQDWRLISQEQEARAVSRLRELAGTRATPGPAVGHVGPVRAGSLVAELLARQREVRRE